MSDDIRATLTRPFATTIAAPSSDGERTARTQAGADRTGPDGADEVILPEVGSVVGMHYRLVRLLGEGNFGRVFVAERVDVPEHVVALKILPRSHYVGRNVERELVMLATVGHPHVVQLKDHGMTSDYVWLTMPVYEGETLAERLERGTLGLREAYELFLPVARGLEALHQAGLRHQDIKPENVFLARFGGRLHPVVLDLGVAAERDASFVAGTALYAAPEQLAAILGLVPEVPLSQKMDTYCFAATLLVALVGERRFPGAKARTRSDVADSHEIRAATPLAEGTLPELMGEPRRLLEDRLRRWMALHAEDRPTMSEVAEQLDVLLEHERELEREEEALHARQRGQIFRLRVGAAALLVAAAGLVGFGLWKRETLRLASELESARAIGAESFDKLDLCVASHAIARRDANLCAVELGGEKRAHEDTLAALAEQGDVCEAAAGQVTELRSAMRLAEKQYEDDLAAAERAARAERERIVAELGVERERLAAANATCESELDTIRADRDACEIERASCLAAQQEDPYGPGRPPATIVPPPVTTSAPTSPPVEPPPANTSSPTGTPPPDLPLPPNTSSPLGLVAPPGAPAAVLP